MDIVVGFVANGVMNPFFIQIVHLLACIFYGVLFFKCL